MLIYKIFRGPNTLKALVISLSIIGSFPSVGFASLLTASDSLITFSEDQIDQETPVNDPLEDVNRSVFRFNQDVDQYILKPLSEGYKAVLPHSTRESVHAFLSNLGSPVILLNDLLQLQGDRAMDTLARFLINTTLGLGGIFDPAVEVFDIPYHQEDFGETLGTYGMEGEPYIMLPILGPSNPRDIMGIIVDMLVDPFSYIAHEQHADYLTYTRLGIEGIDKRGEADEVIRRINKAHDPYTMMRSIYMQNREFNIKKGVVDLESPTPSSQ